MRAAHCLLLLSWLAGCPATTPTPLPAGPPPEYEAPREYVDPSKNIDGLGDERPPPPVQPAPRSEPGDTRPPPPPPGDPGARPAPPTSLDGPALEPTAPLVPPRAQPAPTGATPILPSPSPPPAEPLGVSP